MGASRARLLLQALGHEQLLLLQQQPQQLQLVLRQLDQQGEMPPQSLPGRMVAAVATADVAVLARWRGIR